MFWDSDMRLSFLRDASDRIQRKERRSAILKAALEGIAPRVLGAKPAPRGKKKEALNWDEKIEPSLLKDNRRPYNYVRVRDLMRFIRNNLNHFFDLPCDIQVISHPNTWKLNLYT